MNKKDYYNSVTHQVINLKSLAQLQADRCFDKDKLVRMIAPEIAGKFKRVILTGCGDSYSAVGAILPGFKLLSGLNKCDAPDIMDFYCYYGDNEIRRSCSMDEVLVTAVSFSGNSQRVIDALDKANKVGAGSLLITNNPDSKGARAARYVLHVDTPEGCNTPGLQSYYASLVGLSALAAYIGLCNGSIGEERRLAVKKKIADYTLECMDDFESIDDLMFAEAVRMKDLTKFELIADWNEGYAAQFVEQKFIECGGVFCSHTNSEEYVHISGMSRCPGEIGTIIMINAADKSFSRMRDTINGCLGVRRPVLIVTDGAPALFEGGNKTGAVPGFMIEFAQAEQDNTEDLPKATFCRIPEAPEAWMSPFIDFIPGSLLAGYQAAINEKKYFGGKYDFRAMKWEM